MISSLYKSLSCQVQLLDENKINLSEISFHDAYISGPSTIEPQQPVDYDFAQQEVMMKEMPDDPIQEAIVAMEKQHEDDKQGKVKVIGVGQMHCM